VSVRTGPSGSSRSCCWAIWSRSTSPCCARSIRRRFPPWIA
jgi:hypothetical protein